MLYVSRNITLFGHEPADLMASPHLYQTLIHPDDFTTFTESLAHVFDEGTQRGVSEFRLQTSRGDYRWVENQFTPIRDAAGRLIELEGLLIDVTERKAAEAKILHLARTDQLTGLANRATFLERLRRRLPHPGAGHRRSRFCPSTSIASRRSRIRWAIRPAMSSWQPLPNASRRACGTRISSRAWAATSSPYCSSTWMTVRTPAHWPARSATRWPSRCP